jgi:hypothetical protein
VRLSYAELYELRGENTKAREVFQKGEREIERERRVRFRVRKRVRFRVRIRIT